MTIDMESRSNGWRSLSVKHASIWIVQTIDLKVSIRRSKVLSPNIHLWWFISRSWWNVCPGKRSSCCYGFQEVFSKFISWEHFLSEYQQLLMPYAFSFLIKQLELCSKVKITESVQVDENSYTTLFKREEYSYDCQCNCGNGTAMQAHFSIT